ncbi:MAG: ABC transporter substrate-binding protein [Proteobacteria bacterium]|nr:ABC transporter substrate-binding protein [Pseudomonadota bacterium]
MKRLISLVCLLLIFASCQEKKSQTSSDTFYLSLSAEPPTLNPFTSTDTASQTIHAYVFETLLSRNPDTYDWEPSLAEKWEVSADKKVFTFTIREGVKWSDGKPLTVEDVKYSFDAIFDPELNTAHLRPYYESIEKVEIVDARTVRFYAKDNYFKNFDSIATLTVTPKHYYTDASRKKDHNKVLIGTGPYDIEKYEKGKRIVFVRKEWWGDKANAKKEWAFKRIVMRFIAEENVTLESLKKGDLDFLGLRPEQFVKKTDGPEWGTKLIKVQTTNKSPKGYTFIGWNNDHPIFKDKKVRRALNMLYNRPLAMEKFEFNLSDYATSPSVPSSDFNSPNIQQIKFDPQGALKILNSLGWKDTDGDGVLDRMINGKKVKFSFTLLEPLGDFIKYLTIYKEDAKKVGVEIEIKQIEWNSFIKLLDERKFDAVRLAWGAGDGDPDYKQIWHSNSIANAGSNFIGYRNAEVDKLIDQSRLIYDRPQRIKAFQKMSEIIASEDPYLFLFAGKSTLYAHTARVQKEKDTHTYTIGQSFWTLKP